MPSETPSDSPLFGYLTVVDHPTHGACGGYLVVNRQGRPVEFHCTAPVSPSRGQQILYGPTLRASLYGEQIGPALVGKAKSCVAVVLVNQPECMELQRHTDQRVVLVDRDARTAGRDPQLALFPEMQQEIRTASPATSEVLRSGLQMLAESIDLAEPFERIQEAIYEAQRIGGEGQGSDARAA